MSKTKKSPFWRYNAYVSKLDFLARQSHLAINWASDVHAALNGQSNVEVRQAASIKTQRKFGAFFTGTKLGTCLVSRCRTLDDSSVIYDAGCGAGDLLLAAARKLPIRKTLQQTLQQWGKQLYGTDLNWEFVAAAKMRLVLLARHRHQAKAPFVKSYANFFPNIRVGDGLDRRKAFSHATHLLLNPPFGVVEAPVGCKWAGGKITEAANFLIAALEKVRLGTEILAILPDVLRSGSFTNHWRTRVSELAEVRLVKPYGIFDDTADVDVFLLRLIRRKQGARSRAFSWPNSPQSARKTIADNFDVHVGRVVPHRDPETGPLRPYIHARHVPVWKIMRKFPQKRKYTGKVYKPPFVVIRRTSRPGHPYRAAATVIAGNKSVAVENHLIVCEPKNKAQAMCKKLMLQLKTKAVNEFLDERIRCRHLTVSAVAAIPFQS